MLQNGRGAYAIKLAIGHRQGGRERVRLYINGRRHIGKIKYAIKVERRNTPDRHEMSSDLDSACVGAQFLK